MLGYLSLPPAAGGARRDDVDGLRGGEFNLLDDDKVESFPFARGDTGRVARGNRTPGLPQIPA